MNTMLRDVETNTILVHGAKSKYFFLTLVREAIFEEVLAENFPELLK